MATYIPSKGLRKLPPSDGAGLLSGERFHGRTEPLLGRGGPPPDGFENEDRHLRAWSPERSHLLRTRDILGQRQYDLVPPDPERQSKRQFASGECTARSWALHGGAIHVIEPQGTWSKAKGWGQERRGGESTAERTMHMGQAAGKHGTDSTGRLTRRHGMERLASHRDMLVHTARGEGGGEWRLAADRTSGPTVDARDERADRECAEAGRSMYESNRSRAQQSYAIL